jgi:hypothetical protein
MLYYKTVDSGVLKLINELMSLQVFDDLRLVGGTSLALQIGHRQSVDIDLFGKLTDDEFLINENLKKIGSFTLLKKSENKNVFLLENIKVDIVNYPYHWLEKEIIIDNIRMAGKKDIAAMKLAAVTGRGSKKDFIDIYFLLKEYELSELLQFYNSKYPEASEIIVLKSLTYFDDAEEEAFPRMFIPVDWENVKTEIIKAVKEYMEL